MKTKILLLFILAFVIAGAGIYVAGDVDYTNPKPGHFVKPLRSDLTWGPAKQLRLFFPSQANLQWLSGAGGYSHPSGGNGSMATHPGSSEVIDGSTSCSSCHGSDLAAGNFADNLVNTAAGIPGKDPYKDVTIQAAYDNQYLYVKAEWTTQRPRPGVTHNTYKYLNGSWQNITKNKVPGKNQVDELDSNEFYSYEDRFAVMLAPKSVGDSIKAFGNEGMSFNQAGCFVACHSSMRYMPGEPGSAAVTADPWLGPAGLNVTDLRHYLLYTRGVNSFAAADSTGNWQTTASNYNLAQQISGFNDQKFLDVWAGRAARSAPMHGGSNDAVMDYRHSGLAQTSQGANNWFDQTLTNTQNSNAGSIMYDTLTHKWMLLDSTVSVSSYLWMYDSSMTGFYFLPAEAVDSVSAEIKAEWAAKYPLISQGPDRNAIPYDSMKVTANVLLPRQVLRQSSGIRSMLNVFSKWEESSKKWTAIFRRKLNVAECDHGNFGTYCSNLKISVDDLKSSGQGLTIAFAVFDDHSTARFHHISFPFTMQDNGMADIMVQFNNPVAEVKELAANVLNRLQNYPNPFSDKTDIMFSLPEKANVKLEIRDITGRLITVLMNKTMDAGEQTITWHVPKEINKGIYFCHLQAGDLVLAKRMLMIE